MSGVPFSLLLLDIDGLIEQVEIEGWHARPQYLQAKSAHAEIIQRIQGIESDRDHWRALAERAEDALRRIVAIENKMYGVDWEEIEEARRIAHAALNASREEKR